MVELTREETIKALESCNTDRCEFCPLNNNPDCCELVKKSAMRYLKEKEPAPDSTGTSPEVKTLHIDDTTKSAICQAIAYVNDVIRTVLEVYEEMSNGEKKAFDLGVTYKNVVCARKELEKLTGGDD